MNYSYWIITEKRSNRMNKTRNIIGLIVAILFILVSFKITNYSIISPVISILVGLSIGTVAYESYRREEKSRCLLQIATGVILILLNTYLS